MSEVVHDRPLVGQFVVHYRWTRALSVIMALAAVITLLAEIVIPGGPVRTALLRPSLETVSGALAYAGVAVCLIWGAFMLSVRVRVEGPALEIIRGWGLQRRRYTFQHCVHHSLNDHGMLRLVFADGFRLNLERFDVVGFQKLLDVLQHSRESDRDA